jgi:hypothetical protein
MAHWLWLLFAPAAPRKSMLMDMTSMMITVAALLAGFSLSVATSVDHAQVREYVEWEVNMFVGAHSALCRGITTDQPFASPKRCLTMMSATATTAGYIYKMTL